MVVGAVVLLYHYDLDHLALEEDRCADHLAVQQLIAVLLADENDFLWCVLQTSTTLPSTFFTTLHTSTMVLAGGVGLDMGGGLGTGGGLSPPAKAAPGMTTASASTLTHTARIRLT